jgi:extracellular matrix regulatory protein A
MRLINIGFGNMIVAERIVAVVSPDSAPVKRLVQEARDLKKIVDATQGRRTRAVIVTDSGHVVLSAIQPETVASRSAGRDAAALMEDKEI